MLLNLACSDGISAGFGYIFQFHFHSDMNINYTGTYYYRAPISIEAAFNFGWPFSKELCAAYAMIISTAGWYS